MSRVLASLVVVLSFGFTQADCGRGPASSATDPPPPPDYCAVPAPPTTYSAQYLVGGDVLQSNTLWVFKLDPQTGVPTAMPWSPLILDGYIQAIAADATGSYLYLSVRSGWTSLRLETYRFPRDGSPPVQIDSQNRAVQSPPEQLVFDPQQRYLYEVDRGSINTQSWISVFSIDAAHIPHDTNQTIAFPDDASTIVFKDNGRIALVGRQHASGTGVAVLARDCATGAFTQLSESESPVPFSTFLVGAPQGTGAIGYSITKGAQLMRYDAASRTVIFDNSAVLPQAWFAAFDRAPDFVVTTNAESAQLAFCDVVKGYKYDPARVALTQTYEYQIPVAANGEHDFAFNIAFDVTDRFVYIESHNSIRAFQLNKQEGTLSSLPGSPFPIPVALDPLLVFGQN